MSSPIALQELFKAGFEDFVIPSYETAPFTTIQNRAQVTRSLKAIAGVERVHVNGINRLQNEFGPNGEQVFEAENKDSRIRFVGSTITFVSANDGAYASFGSTTDYVEVTFYGTGLNILSALDGNNRSMAASIDGGSEDANLFTSGSNVISGRSYSSNQVFPVTSGLTLGWHTIKVRRTGAVAPLVFGFEILNERSNLAVYSGAGISNGSFNGLSSLATSAFNDGVVGTRGARVVKYIENGTLKSAVQEVDSTTKYLTNADHTNEEVARRINFREFGANRADDFSTLSISTSDRAFTLDDGTTTLVGNDVYLGFSSPVDGLQGPNAGAFITLTFIGTGLDIVGITDASARSYDILIDGVASGTVSMAANQQMSVLKICSGLSYGTHTVKFNRNAGNSFGIVDFIIYQPKKPSIPVGALEVADYNLMASYAANITAGLETIATGVLRKSCTREKTYVNGTGGSLDWQFNASPSPTSTIGGWQAITDRQNSYFEYTFWGTGFEQRFQIASNRSANIQISLQSLSTGGFLQSATPTNFPTITSSTYGTGVIFNNTTGILDQQDASSQFGGGFRLSNLPLGLWKVRFINNTAGSILVTESLDIITPIHINNSNLKVGSQSLKSVTKYSPEKSISNVGPDLSKAKAWARFDLSTNRITSSHNVSAVLRTGAGTALVYFEKKFKNDSYVVTGSCFDPVETFSFLYATRKQTSDKFQACMWYSNTGSGFDGIVMVACFGELIDE